MWWVPVFFLILAAFLFPIVMLAKHYRYNITIFHQVLIVVAASVVCQLLRKEAVVDMFGTFNPQWIKELFIGGVIGTVLMLAPALFLFAFAGISWQGTTIDLSPLVSATLLFVGVAVVEEVLFRGFLFQRLIGGLGKWPAQIIIGALFVITHLGNPGMTGNIKVFASINIFLASFMFGFAYLRTGSLAMAVGIHFMANWVQGVLLGFGVSGEKQAGFLKPVLNGAPEWLTGGSFGLEASVPGMVSITIAVILLYRWKLFSKQPSE
jgi:hypothetical protein